MSGWKRQDIKRKRLCISISRVLPNLGINVDTAFSIKLIIINAVFIAVDHWGAESIPSY